MLSLYVCIGLTPALTAWISLPTPLSPCSMRRCSLLWRRPAPLVWSELPSQQKCYWFFFFFAHHTDFIFIPHSSLWPWSPDTYIIFLSLLNWNICHQMTHWACANSCSIVYELKACDNCNQYFTLRDFSPKYTSAIHVSPQLAHCPRNVIIIIRRVLERPRTLSAQF